MGKLAFVCLLILLPGICYSSDEATIHESFEATTEPTTVPTTTEFWACDTKGPDHGILDSTSDSWTDIHGTTTPFFTTTTDETPSVSNHLETEHVKQSSHEASSHSREDQNDDDDDDDDDAAADVCARNVSQDEIRKFAQAMMSFSFDLLKQVDKEANKPNVIISPLSIALGLLQLSLGAGIDTEKKLMETLHMESVECPHNKFSVARRELTKTALKVATRIYIKKGFPIKKAFLKMSEKHFGSKPHNLENTTEKSREVINKWIKDATDGKIPNFLSGVPSDLILMLLNAIHFKGVWKNKFDPSMTVPDSFHINNHLTVPVEMMNAQKYPLSWYIQENLESQVARLHFKGNMSFLVIMPLHFEWNVSKILDNFNQTDVYNRFPKERPTTLRMPKLKLDYKVELTKVLAELGLGQLFTNPDFHRISEEHLIVSSVQHQSTMELNEEGVEAAATTAILMSRSLATYSINRPFIFFLFDDNTGLPLFMGYVRDPNPDSKKKLKEQTNNPDTKVYRKGSIPK
ncbi:alpha-2-antiplasmin isoform 2-T2 [Discoglossus pictus]